MRLKQDFLTALRAGADYESLMKLVESHQAQGMTPDASYKALEEIWLEYGFNESTEDSPLRDDLEYVMEKVWYSR